MIPLIKRSAVIDNLQHAIDMFINRTNSHEIGAPRLGFNSNVEFAPGNQRITAYVQVSFMADDDSFIDDWNAEPAIKTLDVNCVEEGV